MGIEKAKAARQLFDNEVRNLVSVNMAKADASSISETAASTSKTNIRQPLLAKVEDLKLAAASSHYETIFEEKFEDVLPDTIIGIEFKEVESLEDDLMLRESVLRTLARNLHAKGVESAYHRHNMATAHDVSDATMAADKIASTGQGEEPVVPACQAPNVTMSTLDIQYSSESQETVAAELINA